MRMSPLLKRYRGNESGATAIEYAIIALMVTVALIGILSTGGAVEALYDSLLAIADAMTEANGGSDGDG